MFDPVLLRNMDLYPLTTKLNTWAQLIVESGGQFC